VNTFLNRPLLRSLLLGAAFSAAVILAQDAPVRVGGNVAAANRISWVTPAYPADAKQNRIQGTVRLEVMIDKDGHVSNVTVASGPAELTQAASDAVSQWVYRPTLLNGKPVTVLTTVDVNFTLSQ
jgi:protein TonB